MQICVIFVIFFLNDYASTQIKFWLLLKILSDLTAGARIDWLLNFTLPPRPSAAYGLVLSDFALFGVIARDCPHLRIYPSRIPKQLV